MRWHKNRRSKACQGYQGWETADDDLMYGILMRSEDRLLAPKILTISAGEERFAAQHFGKYASYWPHINSTGILFEREHDFWGSIPSIHNLNSCPMRGTEQAYRVATYSVMSVLSLARFGGGRAERARPKSHILGRWARTTTDKNKGGPWDRNLRSRED